MIYLTQGLLYLDGRNSQKYLHQTKADFEVSFSLANMNIPQISTTPDQTYKHRISVKYIWWCRFKPAPTKLLGGVGLNLHGVGLNLHQPILYMLSAAAGCCSQIGWCRTTPALVIGLCRFKPAPTNPVDAIAKCLFSPYV